MFTQGVGHYPVSHRRDTERSQKISKRIFPVLFVPSPQHHGRSQNQLPPHQLPQSACHLWSLSEPPGKAASDQLQEPKGTMINTAVCEFHPSLSPPVLLSISLVLRITKKKKKTNLGPVTVHLSTMVLTCLKDHKRNRMIYLQI